MAGQILNEGLAWTRIPSTTSYWSIVRLCSASGRLVTSTTLPHHAPLRDPHPLRSTPPPTVCPVPNGWVLLTLPTRPFLTQSGCLAAAHPVGRGHPSLAIEDRPALPLRWPDQPALPARSAPGASLSTLHTRMLSCYVYHSARLISCRACGDTLECGWRVCAVFTRKTYFCALVWKNCSLFLCGAVPCFSLLPITAPYCPVLPRIAPYCPVLPRTAPYCPYFPFPVPCCGYP